MILLKPHLYQETFFSIASPRISYFLSELQLERLCVNDCGCVHVTLHLFDLITKAYLFFLKVSPS